MNLAHLGLIVAFFTGLFAVVYTPDSYDIWDAALAIVSLHICIRLRREMPPASTELWIARSSVGVALLVLMMVALTAIDRHVAEAITKMRFGVIDLEFAIATALALSTALFERATGSEAQLYTQTRALTRSGKRIRVMPNPSLERRPREAGRPWAAQGSRRLHCPARPKGAPPHGSPQLER